MSPNTKRFRVTLASQDVGAFLAECEIIRWRGYDTGERVMTEEGPDAEAVLVVETAPLAREFARAAVLQ